MKYRSVADLNATIRRGTHEVPNDVDVVVGIPRSGLLAATMMALALDLPVADLEGFLAGRLLSSGTTRRRAALEVTAGTARHVLVVDDSLDSGRSLARAREQVANTLGPDGPTVTYFVVYANEPAPTRGADIVLEVATRPRIFEWNLMHHHILGESCVDIDGVLCVDPTASQNDDGPGYDAFLTDARPLLLPTRPIGCLVTSRLERYRPQTEAWLSRHGVKYDRLVMLDVATAAERRAAGVHGDFKGRFYADSDAKLFIESEHAQALRIAQLSGKDVLCVEHQAIHPASALSPRAVQQRLSGPDLLPRLGAAVQRRVRRRTRQLRLRRGARQR